MKITLQELLETPPDIVLFGINQGPTVGVNILYSGTVSAATEAAFLGVPSAAISLNVNIPAVPSREITDVCSRDRAHLDFKSTLNAEVIPEAMSTTGFQERKPLKKEVLILMKLL